MTIDKISINKALDDARKLMESSSSISAEARVVLNILIVIITLLMSRLKLNSSNSSIPPSKDPNRKKKEKKTSVKKQGGQKGHLGSNLKPIENPDKFQFLDIDMRTLPAGNYNEVGREKRQVFDIEISRIVTEFQAQILEDEKGNRHVASFPDGVTRPAQYGNGFKAQSVYMSAFQLIPFDRVRDYFRDQCSVPVSTGSLVNFNQRAFESLEEFENICRAQLISSSHAHADETGVNVGGKLLWLHSMSNPRWTLYYPHLKRGSEAMNDMGILPKFSGTLCHDHWKPYFKFDCLHALCNAHHLRELEHASEVAKQKWAGRMQKLLLEIKKAVDESADGVLSDLDQGKYIKRYRALLKKAEQECPSAKPPPKNAKKKRGRVKQSKERNLLDRLIAYEDETLRFMTDPQVQFTNNLGENDIRMTKVKLKISGCFRSMDGAKVFCRIRSYLSTCRKNDVLPSKALNMLFEGKMPDFVQMPLH